MTTEEDFQRMLDKSLNDWQTRRIFSDWLQERNDKRWSGYAALAQLKRRPKKRHGSWEWWCISIGSLPIGCDDLAEEWFVKLSQPNNGVWTEYTKRRDAENAAALAFIKLPIKVQKELLSVEAV